MRRDDAELATDKLAYLRNTTLDAIEFDSITPDAKSYWLNQSNGDFNDLFPLANWHTKHADSATDEHPVFKLASPGAKTDRDEWVYDFSASGLRAKALFFADTYNEFLDSGDNSYDSIIKWSDTLRTKFRRGERIVYYDGNRIESLHRPFSVKQYFADPMMSDRLTSNHYEMFGADLTHDNAVICFKGPSANYFAVLAANKLVNEKFAGTNNGGTFCLPLYCYTPDGERVSNITEWGLRQFREHYGDDGITAEDIFAYTYAMLHDPAYRQRFEIDLRREFPRVYFQEDFAWWAGKGRELLDLHLGFETAEPYPLERHDKPNVEPQRAILRADKERGVITLDEQTTWPASPMRRGGTNWAAARHWNGSSTSTRSASPATRPSASGSTPTASPTIKSG